MRVPRQLLRDEVVVEAFNGSGAHGPTYAEPVTIRASIQQSSRVLTGPDASVLATDTQAIIRPEDGPLRPETKLTARGIVYRVVACTPMPDERRPYHYELTLAAWAIRPAGGSGS